MAAADALAVAEALAALARNGLQSFRNFSNIPSAGMLEAAG
jgi:hypothetical protein